jgi:hypothetical protein
MCARAKERQMTKLFSFTAVILGLSTSTAFANGDHGGNTWQVAIHMLTEPDHLAMLSAGIAVCFLLRKFYLRRTN